MKIQRKSILVVFFIFLTPSILFADYKLNTGYDLYHYIKLLENPQSRDDMLAEMHTTGYIAGFVDGLTFTQDTIDVRQ